MAWEPEFETVVQLSAEERKLFLNRDASSVLHRSSFLNARVLIGPASFPSRSFAGSTTPLGMQPGSPGRLNLVRTHIY